MTKIHVLFTLTFLLAACGVQMPDEAPRASSKTKPACGAKCAHPAADAGSKPEVDSGSADAGTPAAEDSGSMPAADAGDTTPAGRCGSDKDCKTGEECALGWCVPAGVIPSKDLGSKPAPADMPSGSSDAPAPDASPAPTPDAGPVTIADTTAPVISDVNVTNITTTSATFTWTTDEDANDDTVSLVMVAIDGSRTQIGLFFAQDTKSLSKTHSVTLDRLSPHTTYSYAVFSTDAAGNEAEYDATETFKTAYVAGPARSGGANRLFLNRHLVNGSECVDVKGDLPGTNWDYATIDMVNDAVIDEDWVSIDVSASSNGMSYGFNYRNIACDKSAVQSYANDGDPASLKDMSPDDLAFVSCTWFDGTTTITPTDQNGDGIVNDSDYYCNLRFQKDASGVPMPAGNMRSYAQ